MDALRQLLNRIQAQMSMLGRSQQLAIALCALVIMGSLLWLMQWSTTPHLEPLLDQPMDREELAAAAEQLQQMRVDFEEIGDRIYVKPGERQKLLRELNTRGALPEDTSLGFENLVKESSPFQPESINKQNFLIALNNELASVIAGAPDVARAKVFINDVDRSRYGRNRSMVRTASVDISTVRGVQMDQARVLAVANLISGAAAGLEPHNVMIAVNGRPRTIPGPEDEISMGLLEEQKKREKHLEEKIHSVLGYIPGVKVAVSVELETTRKHVELFEYTDAEPKREKTQTDEMTGGSTASEAGVSPNTGTALTGGQQGQSSTSETTETEYATRDLTRKEQWEQAPLTVKSVTASVNIPRSYFVSVFTAANPSASEPTDEDLKVLIDIEKLRVRPVVQNAIGVSDESVVQVDWFPDFDPIEGGFGDSRTYAMASAEQDGGTVQMLTSYGPMAGMVGLAVASLVMMFMLVRKSSRAINLLPAAFETTEESDETTPLDSAGLSEGYLVGQELDEDTLRYQNYGHQVSKLVDEDPEAAAELVRRWVDQE